MVLSLNWKYLVDAIPGSTSLVPLIKQHNPLISIGRHLVLSSLKSLKYGQITVVLSDQTVCTFPEPIETASSSYGSDDEAVDTMAALQKKSDQQRSSSINDDSANLPFNYQSVYHRLRAKIQIKDDFAWARILTAGDMFWVLQKRL